MSPSPIRCRGPWKFLKRSSSEPDRWLDEMGFFRKHTARDSSCLFRAISENIYNTQRYYHTVRINCIEFMASNRHLFERSLTCPIENYLKEMSNPCEWGGIIEVSAMSHLYRRDFVIFEANKGPQTNICNGYGNTIYLFFSPDTKHFDAVYTKEYINNSAFCQSLVYELLYDRVYHLEDLSYAINKMLHDKAANNHIEYLMPDNIERCKKQKERAKIFIEESNDDKDKNNNSLTLKCKHHTNDIEKASLFKESLSIFVFNRNLIQLENVCINCLNVNSAKVLLDNGITPFPYKVAKALDPDIYRNIEFDVWSELWRELRYGARYSDGTTLQVGVKCLCKLDVDQASPYHCHIQEMGQDGGPCLVFIEELGEKRIINYDQLKPLPVEEIKPWAPPYRYSRANTQLLNLSQMLQQLGNIARKQSLKASKKSKTDETKTSEKEKAKIDWSEDKIDVSYAAYNYPTYEHVDFFDYQLIPVEIEAVPVMVDCRASGSSPQEINGSAPDNQTQHSGGGDVCSSARASTPATTNAVTPYTGGGNTNMNPLVVTAMSSNMPYNCGPYVCGMKSVVWCSPHSPHQLGPGGMVGHHHVPPPPPPGVNPHVYKSVQPNGADLPMNDIATLRYYYNLGVDCLWAAYAQPAPPAHPAHPAPPPHLPPLPHRHYTAAIQDIQQLSLQERPPGNDKHKTGDKGPPAAPKGNGQRPLLGPRFKRGNNQDNNQNNNHNQNKGYNNSMANKGPNHRRNSYVENRGASYEEAGAGGAAGAGAVAVAGAGAVEQPLVAFPYATYPPPIYPMPYYHVEDPAMMGMMSGMNTMGYVYEDAVEYGLQPMYVPPPFGHPAMPPHHAPHPQSLAPHGPHAPHTPHTPHGPPANEHK